MPPEKAGSYRSYLLRCWQEVRTNAEHPPLWRFVLQDVTDTQKQYAFSSLEQLVDFLRTEILGDETVAKDD